MPRPLPDKICKDCGNLTFWDGYRCREGLHSNKDAKLSERPLKRCKGFVERGNGTRDFCKDVKCVFWCFACPAYDMVKDG